MPLSYTAGILPRPFENNISPIVFEIKIPSEITGTLSKKVFSTEKDKFPIFIIDFSRFRETLDRTVYA